MGGGDFKIALFWMAAAMFSGSPIYALHQYCYEQYRVKLRAGLTQKLYGKLETASLEWMEEQESGKVLSVCTTDLEQVVRWAAISVPELIRVSTYTLAVVGYCFSQSAALTVCVVPVIILIVPFISLISKPLEQLADRQRGEAAASLQKTQEFLGNPEFVKAYGLEAAMERRVGEALDRRRRLEERSAGVLGLIEALAYLASYLPGFIAAGVGIYFLVQGSLSAGFLLGFVQISTRRFGELVPKLGGIVSNTRQAAASGKLLTKILDAPEQKGGAVHAIQGKRLVEMDGVCFGYQPGQAVLKNVSLFADQGEFVAIVGASGSGKSTIFKLLMGTYPEFQGEIRIGGHPIREWDPAALRERVAPVFQHPFLFPFTVEENLWAGEAPADREVLWKALDEACVADFVRGLPGGLDAVMDEEGTSLSGGQRQRMTLARAFVKDAPLILMDEPTSSLDSVTEGRFQQAFDRLRRGRTVLVIAHRLATIEKADRIYVLDHGRVVQQGSHRELMGTPGPYRNLYQSQASEEPGEREVEL